jgi:single-stranded DNA-binding protein
MLPMNTITIHGSITRDPDVSESEGGVPRARFGIASVRSRQEGHKIDVFDVVAFGEVGEKMREIPKGTYVTIKGHVKVENDEGSTMYAIIAKAVEPFRSDDDR